MKLQVLQTWLKDQLKYSNKVHKSKLQSSILFIPRLTVLAASTGGRPNAVTCTESNNVDVSSDANPTTNIEENNNTNTQIVYYAQKHLQFDITITKFISMMIVSSTTLSE